MARSNTALSIPDDHLIQEAVDSANLNALRLALYQMTGDPALAKMKVAQTQVFGGTLVVHELLPEHHAEVKEKARAYLRASSPTLPPIPSESEGRRLIELFTGEPIPDSAVELSIEELGFKEFPRGSEWNTKPPAAKLQAYHVIVVGAGFGGLATAIQLQRLGIPYTLVEREAGVGGTWFINDYPEARVDVPSHDYQFSFEKNYPWTHFYSQQPELQKYLEHCARKYGVFPHIRFNTELTEATWDEASSRWMATLKKADGTEETRAANVIVSAVGVFCRSKLPDIAGIETFKGPMFHTTKWDHGFNPSGKKVGIIGNGCSGAQLMPNIAKKADHLTVFQRTPAWVVPIENYRWPIPDSMQMLFDLMPAYWNWYCFANFYPWLSDLTNLHSYDREWQRAGGFVSERSDRVRQGIVDYLKIKFADRPDLIPKLSPNYAPWAKRPVIDNGFYDALKQPNVVLETTPIEKITPVGIKTKDGVEHKLDAIILGSGFDITRFLSPIQFTGRGGVTLDEVWAKDGSRAYLGMTIPAMPNLFMLFGPNAGLKTGNGAIWLECWARYAVEAIIAMLENGHGAMECRPEVYEAYNARMDAVAKDFIWEGEQISTYYINKHNRSVMMIPWDAVDYYAWIRRPNWQDYSLT